MNILTSIVFALIALKGTHAWFCCRILAGIPEATANDDPRDPNVAIPNCKEILKNSQDDCLTKMCQFMDQESFWETSTMATSDKNYRKDMYVYPGGKAEGSHAYYFPSSGKGYCEDITPKGINPLYKTGNENKLGQSNTETLFLRGHYGDYGMAISGTDGVYMRFCGTKTEAGWEKCTLDINLVSPMADTKCPAQ